MNELYFPVTENCNFECAHCYLSAGPGKRDTTVSRGDFEKIIGNLPVGDTRVILSGGEVTTIREDLNYFLEVLTDRKHHLEKADRFSVFSVEVQTNGSWATSIHRAREVLTDLRNRGVDVVDVASNSRYHKEAGMDVERFHNLRAGNRYLGVDLYIPKGFNEKSAESYFPMGRAKNFDVAFEDLEIGYGRIPCRDAVSLKRNQSDLNLDIEGNVYSCCFRQFKLDGNLIEEPLEKIINRYLDGGDFDLINRRGISALAEKRGVPGDVVRDVVCRQGECALCFRVFGESGDMRVGKDEVVA